MAQVAEAARLSALRSYEVLDTPPEPALDALAAAAARLCGTKVALVSLVDKNRQFFKARFGSALVQTPREGSFCNAAIQQKEPLVVPDATLDDRFRQHPLVRLEPHLRFYAGAPLVDGQGTPLGTLCVLDWVPRTLDERQIDLLQVLASQVVAALRQRKAELSLRRVHETLRRDLGQRLGELSRAGAELRDDSGLAIFAGAESALQVVEDCVDALCPPSAASLRLREVDLAKLCESLVEVLRESGQAKPVFVAQGDCRGRWDPDRISQALSALFEDAMASGPALRIEVQSRGDTVSLYLPASPDAGRPPLRALRIYLARALIEAHGGWVEERSSPAALVVTLPRAS